MSNFENGMTSSDWKRGPNGLHKSSSLPLYKYHNTKYNNYLYNSTNNYPDYIKLPLINYNNQTKMVGEDLDRRNKIKDETLLTKKKFLKYRGLPENYPENVFKDSWYDFHKRKEKERQRKRMHNLIRGEHVLDTESDDDIFRNMDNTLPNKIEDKIKLKQYIPIKKDLAKIMMRINYNMQKKVDDNNYLINKSLNNLERNYNDLKMMIIDKMDRLAQKQKNDFYNLNKFIEMKEKRNRNRSMDNIIENGQYAYNLNKGINDYNNNYNNINYDYYSEKERHQNLELAHRRSNIPNLLDNMVNEIEEMKNKRNRQKIDFLNNLNDNLNKELDNEPDYDINDDYDEYESKDQVNDLNFYNYDNLYKRENNRYNNIYPSQYYNYTSENNYKIKRKSKTEKVETSSNKSFISMSKSSIQKLKKNLKPLSYQNKPQRKKEREDTAFISGDELLRIYEEKNKNKKKSLPKIQTNTPKKEQENGKNKSEKMDKEKSINMQDNNTNIEKKSNNNNYSQKNEIKSNYTFNTKGNNNNTNYNNKENKTPTKLKESQVVDIESNKKEDNQNENKKKEEKIEPKKEEPTKEEPKKEEPKKEDNKVDKKEENGKEEKDDKLYSTVSDEEEEEEDDDEKEKSKDNDGKKENNGNMNNMQINNENNKEGVNQAPKLNLNEEQNGIKENNKQGNNDNKESSEGEDSESDEEDEEEEDDEDDNNE